MKTYEAIEDILVEKICEAHYEDIEDFLGYPISADVLEELDIIVRDILDNMTEDEMLYCEHKFLNN